MHCILKTINVHKYKFKFSLYKVMTCMLHFSDNDLCMLLVITKMNDTR
jgi:hypothetical protein